MLFDKLCRLAARLAHASGKPSSQFAIDSMSQSSDYPFDPVWHGDHWQNLLSSPMDARHYVMEDWSLPTEPELAPVTVSAKRR